MNLYELIDKKKEEIISEIEERFKRQYKFTIEDAKMEIERFVEQLKMTIDAKPITAEDLLKIIEKGGIVSRLEIDIRDKLGCHSLQVSDLLSTIGFRCNEFGIPNKKFEGKIRITLFIEPID